MSHDRSTNVRIAAAVANSHKVPFNRTLPRRRKKKLGIVGSGEVVQQRLWPALQAIDYPFTGLVVCSREPHSVLDGLPHQYYQVGLESLLPFDHLYEQGFLGQDTLWLITTPSAHHVTYTLQLAGLCRVGVEKPIAASGHQARFLQPFTDDFEVYPLHHKMFNASALACIEACRRDPALLRRVRHITGVFYETAGISHGREQEDCILDVQWHPITTGLIAPFTAAGMQFDVTVEQVQMAAYTPDPQGQYARPTVWTASRLQGRLAWDEHEVTYDFCQAKAAHESLKGVRFFDRVGGLVQEIDLGETGHVAHARILQTLLQPVVDMRLTLADTIAVMDLIDTSRQMAHEKLPYAFGSLPDFLLQPEAWRLALPRVA